MTKDDFETIRKVANDKTLKTPRLPALDPTTDHTSFARSLDGHLTTLHREFKTLLLPNLHESKTIAVFSDYGGEHPESQYFTYSFLFHEYDSLQLFNTEIKEIRNEYGMTRPYKEIAFKSLRYGPLKASLDRILLAANNMINGLLVTIVVDKRVRSTFGFNHKAIRKRVHDTLAANSYDLWNDKTLLKLTYISHTIAYFLKLLAREGQMLFWMSDEDSILSNLPQKEAAAQIVQNTISYYCGEGLITTFGYATPFSDNTEIDFSSLLSISDLVAGAIADYHQQTNMHKKPMVSTDEVDKILSFVSRQGILLKKLCLIFSHEKGESYTSGVLNFHSKTPDPNAVVVPISM
jgi:hypothetical protein